MFCCLWIGAFTTKQSLRSCAHRLDAKLDSGIQLFFTPTVYSRTYSYLREKKPAKAEYLAALAGATYVSIFSGRVRDMGYDVRPVIEETRKILDREKLASQIIVGSTRHMMDVNEALQCGAHILTVTPPILRKMLWNPRTEETIREFNTAWAKRGG